MADEKSKTDISTTSAVITSTSGHEGSDTDPSNPISSSDDSELSGNIASSSSNNEEQVVNEAVSQSHVPTQSKLLFNDPAVSSSSENGNGVADSYSKSLLKTPNLVLKPSALGGGSSFQWKNCKIAPDSSSNTKSPLRSPKLNFASSIGASSPGPSSASATASASASASSNFKLQTPKLGANPFAVKSPTSEQMEDDPVTSSNTTESKLNTESSTDQKGQTPNIGNNPSTSLGVSTPLSVPNFVFGQNLHERVSANVVKPAVEQEPSKAEPSSSNGNSEMLFTSVLSKNDPVVKENSSKDTSNLANGKESSTLVEDAARYQEARSNKRKYEEVLLTTGEEEEENILQINVKLFAFDNGSWLERGRATLRLNDKMDKGVTTSRIVVRTVGTLRVVLNTKIWKGMSLSQANERSIRLTALDNDGQLKIFLIQSSPKDMSALYRSLEYRLKRCKELGDDEDSDSPEKRIALSSSSNSPISVPVPTKQT